MKRLLSFLLCFAVLLPQMAFADFSDVEDSPYEASIDWMYRNQAVEGYRDGGFDPESCTTRAEFLIMLYKMLEIDYYRAELDFPDAEMMEFSDVNPGDWYYPVVKRGVLSGAVEGYLDGTFQPHWCINRAEAIKVAVLEFNNGDVPEGYWEVYMEDLDPDQWYFEYVDFALSTDQVGTEHALLTELYSPEAVMTREEVAEMLYRMKTVRDHELYYYSEWYEPFPLESELFFNNCSAGYFSDEDRISVQSVLPYNSDLVFGVNYSHDEEVRHLDNLLEEYVTEDMWAMLIDEYNMMDMPNTLTYEAGVEPFLTEDWNLAVSIVFPEDVDDLFYVDEDDMEYYVIGSFAEYEAFENFLGRWLHIGQSGDISCEREGDYVYWTAEDADLYLAHRDGLFVATNTAENREKAVERADNSEEFEYGTDVETFYGFVSEDIVAPFMEEMEDELAWQTGTSLGFDPADLGDVSFTADAEAAGIRIETTVELAEDSALAEFYEGELSLVDEVYGTDLLFYMEAQDFLGMADMQLESFGTSLYDWMTDQLDTSTLEEDESVIVALPIDEEDFTSLLDAPFAFAMNSGDWMPSFNFYLDFTDKDEEMMADFQSSVQQVADELLVWWAPEYSEEDGMDLWTIALDEEMDLVLRSGILESSTYLLSLDTTADSAVVDGYGEDTVAENTDYMAVIDELDGLGVSIGYWNPAQVVTWFENSVWASELDYMSYEEALIWDFIGNIGAGASTAWMEDGVVHSEIFIGIR